MLVDHHHVHHAAREGVGAGGEVLVRRVEAGDIDDVRRIQAQLLGEKGARRIERGLGLVIDRLERGLREGHGCDAHVEEVLDGHLRALPPDDGSSRGVDNRILPPDEQLRGPVLGLVRVQDREAGLGARKEELEALFPRTRDNADHLVDVTHREVARVDLDAILDDLLLEEGLHPGVDALARDPRTEVHAPPRIGLAGLRLDRWRALQVSRGVEGDVRQGSLLVVAKVSLSQRAREVLEISVARTPHDGLVADTR